MIDAPTRLSIASQVRDGGSEHEERPYGQILVIELILIAVSIESNVHLRYPCLSAFAKSAFTDSAIYSTGSKTT